MSAPVVNFNKYRETRAARNRFYSVGQRSSQQTEKPDLEITPEDIKSFMCFRAIWKTFLSDPVGFAAKLFVISMLFITVIGILSMFD